jgi:hypothetical protein
MLSMMRPLFDVDTRSVLRNTLGEGNCPGRSDVSGPKKMTVGCVMRTVPLRKSVSHAVVADTKRARHETRSASVDVMLMVDGFRRIHLGGGYEAGHGQLPTFG